MREHGARAGHPYGAAEAERSVSQRNGEVTEEDAELQTMVAAARPTGRDQRADEGTQAASAEQDAHAEHRATGGIDMAPMHGELMRAQHCENDPTGADHELASFGEYGGQQGAVMADVADPFEHGREVHQIARAQWSCRFGVRFCEV